MLTSLFEKENKNRNKAAFQTLVYSYILHKNHPDEITIKPGILNLRGIFEEDYNGSLKNKENGNQEVDFLSMTDEFEKQLISLLNEIFDPSIDFQKTTVEENCIYCTYRQICQS